MRRCRAAWGSWRRACSTCPVRKSRPLLQLHGRAVPPLLHALRAAVRAWGMLCSPDRNQACMRHPTCDRLRQCGGSHLSLTLQQGSMISSLQAILPSAPSFTRLRNTIGVLPAWRPRQARRVDGWRGERCAARSPRLEAGARLVQATASMPAYIRTRHLLLSECASGPTDQLGHVLGDVHLCGGRGGLGSGAVAARRVGLRMKSVDGAALVSARLQQAVPRSARCEMCPGLAAARPR